MKQAAICDKCKQLAGLVSIAGLHLCVDCCKITLNTTAVAVGLNASDTQVAVPAPMRGEPRISTDLQGQTIYDAERNVLGTMDERNNWHPVWE
jgi:hypothetical protein